MTSATTNPEYPILSQNTVMRGQKTCSKGFEKGDTSKVRSKNIISFQGYKEFSSYKNKTYLEEKYLLIRSSDTTQRTITAYQNTLKTYARWASPVNKAIKQL